MNRRLVVLCLLVAGALGSAETPRPGAELVYLPYEELPPADDQARVLLPYERFLELWERAHGQQQAEDEPYAVAAFEPVRMSGSLSGDVLDVRLEGALRASGEGWHSLRLPADLHLDDFAIERLTGSAAGEPLLQHDGQSLRLHLPGAGRWRWRAGMSLPVERGDDGRSRVAIVVPPAPVIRFAMPLPGEGVVVSAEPSVAATVVEKDGVKRWEALFSGRGRIDLSWEAGRDEDGDAGPAVLLGELRSVIAVGERQVRYDCRIAIDVVRGRAEELRLSVPEACSVTRVDLAGLRDWSQTGEALLLRLERPTAEDIELQLGLERVLEEGERGVERQLQLGWPRLEGARRQTGWVALRAEPGLRVRLSEHPELLQIDPAGLDWVAGAVSAYRFLRPPPPSQLALTPLQPSLDTRVEQILRLGHEEDELVAALAVDVRQAGIFALSVLVDRRWELVDSQGLAYEDLRDEITDDGRRRLRFTVARRLLGEQELQLRFRAPASISREERPTAIDVSFLTVEGSRRSRGAIVLAAPRSWSLHSGERQGLAPAEVTALRRQHNLDRLPRILRDDDQYALAFTWISPDPALAIEARPRQSELEVHQEDRFELGDGHGSYRALLHCSIRYAALAELDLRLPAAFAEQLTAEHGALAEQRLLPAAEGAVERVLRLRFQTPQIGEQRITLSAPLPVPDLQAGVGNRLQLLPAAVVGAQRSRHTVAIVRSGGVELQASSAMDPVAPADLPATLRGEGVVAGFGGPGVEPIAIEMVRHDVLDLVDASVLVARYSATLTHESMLRVRGNLLLHHRGRPYLALKLPSGARLMELAVDGRSGQHSRRADDDAVLVRLGGGSGLQTVAFIYEQQLSDDELGWLGAVDLALSTMAPDADGERVPVEETLLALHLPEDILPYGFDGSLRHLERAHASLRFTDDHLNDKLSEPAAAGLTMRYEPRGRRFLLRRFGDGGELAFSWLSRDLQRLLVALLGIGSLIAAWWLRRRPARLWAASLVALLLLVLGGPVWLPIWGIAACLLALGGLLGTGVALWQRLWQPRPDPLLAEPTDWRSVADEAGLPPAGEPDSEAGETDDDAGTKA